MRKVTMQRLKPSLVDIKNSKMIYMGDTDGYDDVFQRIAPDLWKRRGGSYRYPVMNDREVQSYIYSEMRRSLSWWKQEERVNLDLVWNDKRKKLAFFF